MENTNAVQSSKGINWGLWIVSFILPPLGYILYCNMKEKNTKKSLSSGWGALFGVLFYIVAALAFILFIYKK